MINEENSSKILVVSDVHVGAFKSELDSFQKFLKAINTGEFGNELQALIILGDFFDLCTDTPHSLFNNTQIKQIIEELIKIQSKKDKNVVFVLGNHEIPVTGNYDVKFNDRKNKFFERVKIGVVDDIFDKLFFCQYVILKKYNNEDTLLLYNSIEDMFDGHINKIKIHGLELENNYECLMTHGYQFDSDIFRFLAGMIWKTLIKSDDIALKEAFDYLWNIIIKGDQRVKDSKLENMLDQLPELKNLEQQTIIDHFSGYNTYNFAFVKLIMRILEKWDEAQKYEYYIDGISDFLKDNKQKLSNINHLIYGHSHKSERSTENINNNEITIVNDGAWQHVNPTYVRISPKGKLEIKNYIPTIKV